MQNNTPETRGFDFMRLFFAAAELFAHHVRLQLFENAIRAVGLLMIFQARHQRPRGGNTGIATPRELVKLQENHQQEENEVGDCFVKLCRMAGLHVYPFENECPGYICYLTDNFRVH